jgi:hypothetical protein
MIDEPEKSVGELRIEMRQMRRAVNALSDAVEDLADEQKQAQGTDTQRATAARKKAQNARDIAGPTIPENERIIEGGER